ncbi:MAG: hypothetical protein LBQ88_14335, partial [Treponema sp.]|nr:hypothetical protein [Treponema sp.]
MDCGKDTLAAADTSCPIALVDFLHIHAKNPDQWACFRSLQGINIHKYEYLYHFMREAQQTPRALQGL